MIPFIISGMTWIVEALVFILVSSYTFVFGWLF